MLLKGIFKDTSAFVQLLVLGFMIAAGFVATTVLSSILIAAKFGISPEVLQEVMQNLGSYPDLMREIQLLQVLVAFIFPAIICARLFSDNYKNYLQVDAPVSFPVMGLAVLSILVAIPLMNLTSQVNQQLVLPEYLKGLEEWMKAAEKNTGEMLEKMLYVRSARDLMLNILIICVLAGIGEEFIFRGVLQTIFGRMIRNPHVVIWIVAIIFSAIHLQFYGFVPRMLLGAYLGYLLYYTKNIWVPVLAHFTNNCFGVVCYSVFQDNPGQVETADLIGTGSTLWLSVVSLVLFLFLFRKIQLRSKAAESVDEL
ncbi:MAG: CPBP family intramembrane metalloprotease [Dysgonamonadaceae bacterium]|jgi:membrane protease YdiL (CAAX protease family)|nr:CPBP family intramembrane metalloprotease [Dysgonamonadaceae bacterium]